MTRAKLIALSLALASCSGSSVQTRPVRLVSAQIEVDRDLAEARRAALEGTPAALEAAERRLRQLIERAPREPLAQVARVWLVRVLVARDQIDAARIELLRIDVSPEPDLVAQRDIAHGVLDARDAARSQNTADHHAHLADAQRMLSTLERTRPDRAETVEMACALAECAAIDTDANRAVRTLARTLATVERAETAGTPWVRTGLRCEDPAQRAALVTEVAERAGLPNDLARAIDEMPEGSSLRRPLALRLLELAREQQIVPNFMRYFADLPDDRATQNASDPSLSNTIVIGVVLPLSGPRSAVGTSVLRGAQLALERIANVRIAVEDEGINTEQTAAAIDRLAAQRARAILGPTRDELAAPAAIRAQSQGISLYLLAVPPDIGATGALVRAAAPSTSARAEAIARATGANGRSPRALVIAATDADKIAEATEDALLQLGIGASRAVFSGTGAVPQRANMTSVFVGDPGREARTLIARSLRRGRGRWVLDARSALNDYTPSADESAPSDPRAVGPWVGVRAGEGFAPVLSAWCARFGESPDELALLAHDAALRAYEALRRAPSGPALAMPALALDPQLSLVSATIAANAPWSASMPAAAARCPARSTP